MGKCAEDTPHGVLIFFRDVPAGAAFRERFAKNPGAARITMRAQAHLEQDGTCTIDNKSGDRVGVHRALGGEGLSACSGDIPLESLVACAGVTLGQIAKPMETDSDVMLPMKYWEIVADRLSAAGRSWGYCSAVTRKRS